MRIMNKKYPDDARLTKLQMHLLVFRFQRTRWAKDSCQNNSGRPRARRLDVVKSQNEHLMKILLDELCTYLFINKIDFYVP